MIVNYNAGKAECLKYLIQNLKEAGLYDAGKNYAHLNGAFYDFLNQELFELLYKTTKENFFKKHGYSFDFMDAHINLAYLNSVDIQEVIKIDNQRWIYNKKTPKTTICE